jgi:site-specific DNA-methyltransferase (adenine-specific)
MIPTVIAAFQDACDGWSADRVVADPELNTRFIEACRTRSLENAPVELNLKLINARKRGLLPRGARRTVVPKQYEFAFAGEIAIRSLERKHNTTLDRVLCDPTLAVEFDAVSAMIAPGFSPLEYRWAALRLRKTSRLKPELLARVIPSSTIGPIPISGLEQSTIPMQQGLYIILNHEHVLYVGEAVNLRTRLRKHLEHSDNKFLARYIWEFGEQGLLLEYRVLPDATRTNIRKALELELIRSRRAEFNVRR